MDLQPAGYETLKDLRATTERRFGADHAPIGDSPDKPDDVK
jgi:hypothetical protein